jgi:hypothetical protein
MSTGVDHGALARAIDGEVIARGESGWETARQAWNLSADQRPPLIVFADSVADIAQTVRFAAGSGLRVAPQSTGHGATSIGDLTGTVLLKTTRLTGVEVDPVTRVARVDAGALWSDVVGPAGEHGLAALHGLAGTVGVAGYTLGGGVGWLSRQEGFASSHVRAFEVVGADGETRRIDGDADPDLFWALRGGGGRPVIVTSFEFGLFELPSAFAGALMWPLEDAEKIVAAWREWIPTMPVELSSTLRLLRFPPLPAIPEPLRGRQIVAVILAYAGDEVRGTELVAPLRAVARPYLDTLATVPAAALAELAGDPKDPIPALGHAFLLDAISAEATGAILELAGPGVDTPLTAVELRQLGGALSDPAGDPGAAGALGAEGIVYSTGAAMNPELGDAIGTAQSVLADRLSHFSGPRDTLLAFDEQRPWRTAFDPGVADRLEAIWQAADPDGVLVANHVDN